MTDEELINLLTEIKDLCKREKDNETYLLAYYRRIDELNTLRTKNEILRKALVICKTNIEGLQKQFIDPWYRDNLLKTIQAALDAAGG